METRAERARKREEENLGNEATAIARKKVKVTIHMDESNNDRDSDTEKIEDILTKAWEVEEVEKVLDKTVDSTASSTVNISDLLESSDIEIEELQLGECDVLDEGSEIGDEVVDPVLVDLCSSASDFSSDAEEMSDKEGGDTLGPPDFRTLTLYDSQDDDDQQAKAKNKLRKKPTQMAKIQNKCYFFPRPVLEKPSGMSASGRNLRREGFNIFNRLTCKDCGKTFHKAHGLSTHPCPGVRR